MLLVWEMPMYISSQHEHFYFKLFSHIVLESLQHFASYSNSAAMSERNWFDLAIVISAVFEVLVLWQSDAISVMLFSRSWSPGGWKNQWNGQVRWRMVKRSSLSDLKGGLKGWRTENHHAKKMPSRCGPGIWVEMVDCHIYSHSYIVIGPPFFSKSPKLFRPPPSFKKALSSPKSWPNVSWIWCKSWREKCVKNHRF